MANCTLVQMGDLDLVDLTSIILVGMERNGANPRMLEKGLTVV